MERLMQPPDPATTIQSVFDTLPPMSDEAIAQILEWLYQLVEQFESRFYAQLIRYADEQRPAFDSEPFIESDPPF
jgi:hypothetical protein